MASTFTNNKNIEKPARNDYPDTWEVPVNGNSGIIDACLGNVTYINMTGRSSYPLTYADLQASTIVFQNALNNATVQVLIPTTVTTSANVNIVNQTTTTGTSSLLQIAWATGGDTFDINQGETITIIADGSTKTLGQAGLSYLPFSLNIAVTGDVTLTRAQCRYNSFILSGVNSGAPNLRFSTTMYGRVISFYKGWTGGGTVSLNPPSGGGGATLTGSGVGLAVLVSAGTGGFLGGWFVAV